MLAGRVRNSGSNSDMNIHCFITCLQEEYETLADDVKLRPLYLDCVRKAMDMFRCSACVLVRESTCSHAYILILLRCVCSGVVLVCLYVNLHIHAYMLK